MIWLAWRRHRTNLLIVLGSAIVLMVWMAFVVHWFESAPIIHIREPGGYVLGYRNYGRGALIFRLTTQVQAIQLLLLLFPCLLGILLGVPLVAGELADHTNRLAWTQGVSRTRWLTTKWVVVGVPLLLITESLTLVTNWWSEHAAGLTAGYVNFDLDGFGSIGRIRPSLFAVGGIAPLAYTVFAFALGTALGSLMRRVSWAVVGTVLIYGVAALVMATSVRPVLAPQVFVPFNPQATGPTRAVLYSHGQGPWSLGSGARFVPGYTPAPGSPSASARAARCNLATLEGNCLADAHIELGQLYQPASHYWELQWREAGIYLLVSLLLLGAGLGAVRRWRA